MTGPALDELEKVLNLPTQDESDSKELVNEKNGLTTNSETIYNELSELVKKGNCVLDQAIYMINATDSDGETISGVASLINSIKDTIKEFTKLHQDEIRFQRQKELEEFKTNKKKELLKLKHQLTSTNINIESEDKYQYTQESIVRLLEGKLDK